MGEARGNHEALHALARGVVPVAEGWVCASAGGTEVRLELPLVVKPQTALHVPGRRCGRDLTEVPSDNHFKSVLAVAAAGTTAASPRSLRLSSEEAPWSPSLGPGGSGGGDRPAVRGSEVEWTAGFGD